MKINLVTSLILHVCFGTSGGRQLLFSLYKFIGHMICKKESWDCQAGMVDVFSKAQI